MKFNTRIDAIKAIRSLPTHVLSVSLEGNQINCTTAIGIGLREAKEMVEAIMEIDGSNTITFLNEKIARLEEDLAQSRKAFRILRDGIAFAMDAPYRDDNEETPSF